MIRACLVVALVAVAVYAASLGAGFVWDDHVLIEANPRLAHLGEAPVLFGAHAFGGAQGGLAGERVTEYYRPIWTLSLALDRAAWGLRPAGFHLTSVLLHAAVSVLVLLLARALVPDPRAALAGALIFAVHPAHVEAVAWVSARNELLCALFGVLALLLFVSHLERGGWGRAAGSLFACALALLSKEMAVVLPLLALAVLALCPSRKRSGLLLALGLAIVAAAYLLLRSRIVTAASEPHALSERLLTAPVLIAHSLQLVVLPIGLRVFHEVPVVHGLGLPLIAGVLTLALLAGVVAWLRRRAPVLALGVFWMPLALLPVSGIAGFTRPALIAERYLYLPSVGLSLAVAAWIERSRAGAKPADSRAPGAASRKPGGAPRVPGWSFALALGVAALFALITAARVPLWHGDLPLMSRMIEDAPGEPSGHANLGAAYERAGRIDQALGAYGDAARLAPGDPQLRTNYATALGKSGRDAEARTQFEAVLAIRPREVAARAGLGWLDAREGRWEDSEREYRAAAAIDPRSAKALAGWGLALQRLGRTGEAERSYRAALAIDPAELGARRNLGLLYSATGRPADAMRELGRAVADHPESPQARLELGVVLGGAGRQEEASQEFLAALALRPDWAEAHFDLGAVRAMQGRSEEARRSLEAARARTAPADALRARIDAALRGLPARR